MKKKANGILQGLLRTHRCSQKDGEHYDSPLNHALILNYLIIHIVLKLMLMAGWEKGAICFLKFQLQDGEHTDMKTWKIQKIFMVRWSAVSREQ